MCQAPGRHPFACYGDGSWFLGVFVMPVAAPSSHPLPAVLFNYANRIPYFGVSRHWQLIVRV